MIDFDNNRSTTSSYQRLLLVMLCSQGRSVRFARKKIITPPPVGRNFALPPLTNSAPPLRHLWGEACSCALPHATPLSVLTNIYVAVLSVEGADPQHPSWTALSKRSSRLSKTLQVHLLI